MLLRQKYFIMSRGGRQKFQFNQKRNDYNPRDSGSKFNQRDSSSNREPSANFNQSEPRANFSQRDAGANFKPRDSSSNFNQRDSGLGFNPQDSSGGFCDSGAGSFRNQDRTFGQRSGLDDGVNQRSQNTQLDLIHSQPPPKLPNFGGLLNSAPGGLLNTPVGGILGNQPNNLGVQQGLSGNQLNIFRSNQSNMLSSQNPPGLMTSQSNFVGGQPGLLSTPHSLSGQPVLSLMNNNQGPLGQHGSINQGLLGQQTSGNQILMGQQGSSTHGLLGHQTLGNQQGGGNQGLLGQTSFLGQQSSGIQSLLGPPSMLGQQNNQQGQFANQSSLVNNQFGFLDPRQSLLNAQQQILMSGPPPLMTIPSGGGAFGQTPQAQLSSLINNPPGIAGGMQHNLSNLSNPSGGQQLSTGLLSGNQNSNQWNILSGTNISLSGLNVANSLMGPPPNLLGIGGQLQQVGLGQLQQTPQQLLQQQQLHQHNLKQMANLTNEAIPSLLGDPSRFGGGLIGQSQRDQSHESRGGRLFTGNNRDRREVILGRVSLLLRY